MAKLQATRGAQNVLTSTFEFDITDTMVNTSGTETAFSAASGVFDTIFLPQSAVVVGGEVIVETASNDTTTATISVGDATDDDRYGAAIDMKTAGRTALTLTGYSGDLGENIRFTIANGTADATAGTVRVNVAYIIENRVNETQTH